jgi:hypothetical protein
MREKEPANKGKYIGIWIHPQSHDALKKKARADSRTLASYVRVLIEKATGKSATP